MESEAARSRPSESIDVEELIDRWNDFDFDSKTKHIDTYLRSLSAIESGCYESLDRDQDFSLPDESLIQHINILHRLDLKLRDEWEKKDEILRESQIKYNSALQKLYEFQLAIWDILELAKHIPESHVKWMEKSVYMFERREQIEDCIFDVKRYSYKPQKERERKRSSSLEPQDYMILKRRRRKEQYLREARRKYDDLGNNWRDIATKYNGLSKLLTREYKYIITNYRMNFASFINSFRTLLSRRPQMMEKLARDEGPSFAK